MEELENEVRSCLWGMSIEELQFLKERPYILDEVIYYMQQEKAEDQKKKAKAGTVQPPRVYHYGLEYDTEENMGKSM